MLQMWTALCKNVLDVFADSDLYLTDGFWIWRSMSDMTRLWNNSGESAGGCDLYDTLWISLIDSCIVS